MGLRRALISLKTFLEIISEVILEMYGYAICFFFEILLESCSKSTYSKGSYRFEDISEISY